MSEIVDVSGKVAVITGASRGIGAGLARDFVTRGMRVGLCARSQPAADSGPDLVSASVDVRDAAAVEAFANQVESQLGPIDLWINNAGVLEPIAPLRKTDPDAVARHIEINVLGVFNGSRTFINHRRRHGGGGHLVNISSGAGRHGYAGWSAYCAGKAAVDRLTECIAIEEQEIGLRAYSLAPGIIDTRMQEQIRASSEEDFPQVGRFLDLKREGKFSSTGWVAARLLELVFDPEHATDDVLTGLPLEHS